MKPLLLLFAIIPLTCFHWTRSRNSEHAWLFSGVSFGVVASPVSLGMAGLTAIPILGKLLGLIGIFMTLMHGFPGYFIGIALGLQEPGAVLTPSGRIVIEIISGVLWGVIYGMIGYFLDSRRMKRNS